MDQEVKSEQNENNDNIPESSEKTETAFKKPTLLIGKRGRLPRKISVHSTSINTDQANTATDNSEFEIPVENQVEKEPHDAKVPAPTPTEREIPYEEPDWSGLPESSGKPYKFEVLKNGTIIETIDLMKKPFSVFGRFVNCDICMQHPTISRFHAVIQYRDVPSEEDPPGFYIYDLGSTHGTFLNGKNNKLKPKVYAPVKVGHMIRFGHSQRSYILTGPEDDQEEESELSVTELKALRAQQIKEHEDKMRQLELEREEKKRKEEERGVDWGMGDDADEDEDIGENPYASTTNEELYLDDPKKALRGFFEREGMDLEYDCSEQGMGQFLCKVELPLDDELGKPIVAEVVHRGKKKEAVVQCALEACRILDRYGVLRQATHESKKRKKRSWEENDYYDSDEDTFLDRTGTIEKKREKRMKGKEPKKPETYESLLAKEKDISCSIAELEKKLSETQAKLDDTEPNANPDEDSLDSYMRGLRDDKPDKHLISKLRLDLSNLKKSHANVIRLINIARPANLPPLIAASTSASTSSAVTGKRTLPIFGKRRAIPVKFPAKPSDINIVSTSQTYNEDMEEESDEVTKNEQNESEISSSSHQQSQVQEALIESTSTDVSDALCTDTSNMEDANNIQNSDIVEADSSSQDSSVHDPELLDLASSEEHYLSLNDCSPLQRFHETETFKKFEKVLKSGLPAVADKHKANLLKILRKFQRLVSTEDRMSIEWKTLAAKRRKVMKWVCRIAFTPPGEIDLKLQHRVVTELTRITEELNEISDDKCKIITHVKQIGLALKTISLEIDEDIKRLQQRIEEEDSNLPQTNVNESDDRPSLATDADSSQFEADRAKDEDSSSFISTEEASSSSKPGCSSDPLEEIDEKKKKKNQKRSEQRQHKAELEKQKGYQEDASKENYNMWVPPTDQSGDGRTTLNDKFGY